MSEGEREPGGRGPSAGGRADVQGPGAVSLNRLLGQAERHVAGLLEATLAADGMTVDQWRVLDLLADGEGHPMSEIAATIVLPGPTLTKIIDRLIDAATVYRLVDTRDRRRVLAFISDHGRDVHRRVAPQVADAEAGALEVLDPDGPTLVALLSRFARGRRSGVGGRSGEGRAVRART